MLTDVNETYYGDHLTIYTNSESLYYMPQTNIYDESSISV